MAFNPALTCWTAWLPVMAPSAGTYDSALSCSMFHSRSAPWRARVWSIWNEPRRRLTSCWVYGRVIPRHRGLVCQLGVVMFFSHSRVCILQAVDLGLHFQTNRAGRPVPLVRNDLVGCF